MEELTAMYCTFSGLGFIVLREAVHSRNDEWVNAEIDLLHNVPSLIGEPNLERHRYFWFAERELYAERIAALGLAEAKSRMLTYYEPIWREMEPVLMRLLQRSGTP